MDIAKYIAELCINILTILAIIMPNKPIIKKPPKAVKSLLVVYPYKLIAAKVAEDMKNTLAIDAPV